MKKKNKEKTKKKTKEAPKVKRKTKNIPKGTTSWVHDDLDLEESPIDGLGLFATKKIKKGTPISVFGGRVYTLEEMDSFPEGSAIGDDATQLDDYFFLGPLSEKEKEWGFFINHSCNPNTKVWRSVFLVAIKNIESGEEITFDYSHSNNKNLDFECSCGSSVCRGFVGSDDWLNQEYIENNYDHFAEWMQDMLRDMERWV